MRYAKIIKYDAGNWEGVNTTIFFSGCTFKCPGCFNADLQSFEYGNEYTKEVEDLFISYAKNPHVDGVCILGGEPFQQDPKILLHLFRRIENEVHKPIHVWTGYTFEVLFKHPILSELLYHIDTLVDGRFEIAKKDLSLRYRGSSNQRVIDVKETIRQLEIVEIDCD